jgi:acetyl-CoA carboxylase carboxyltransferase component
VTRLIGEHQTGRQNAYSRSCSVTFKTLNLLGVNRALRVVLVDSAGGQLAAQLVDTLVFHEESILRICLAQDFVAVVCHVDGFGVAGEASVVVHFGEIVG